MGRTTRVGNGAVGGGDDGAVGGRVVELVAPRQLRIEPQPVPSPGPGQALIRTTAVGVCGTDLHAYAGRHDALPVVLGHDVVGRVHEIGEGVGPGWVGRRVTIDPSVACGACALCRAGRPGLCANGGYMGMTAPGALAEYLCVDADRLVAVPDAVSDVAATVLEPVVVALRLLERCAPLLPAGAPAAVVGGGPLGIVLAQVVQHRGHAATIFEPVARRRDLAERLGLRAVPPEPLDFGEGPRLVAESSATAPGFALAKDLATPGSVIGVIGRAPATVDVPTLLLRELAVVGIKGGTGHYPEAVDLVATGAVQPDAVVTHRFPLAAAADAFAQAADRNGTIIRAVLEM